MIFLHHIFFKKFQLFFIPIFIYETEKGRGVPRDFSPGTSNSTFFCFHHYHYFLPDFIGLNFYEVWRFSFLYMISPSVSLSSAISANIDAFKKFRQSSVDIMCLVGMLAFRAIHVF
jgi:hypothetical protein